MVLGAIGESPLAIFLLVSVGLLVAIFLAIPTTGWVSQKMADVLSFFSFSIAALGALISIISLNGSVIDTRPVLLWIRHFATLHLIRIYRMVDLTARSGLSLVDFKHCRFPRSSGSFTTFLLG